MSAFSSSRGYAILALLAVLAVIFEPGARAGGFAGEFNLILGQKSLEPDDWKPVEDQIEVGLESTWGGSTWPIHIAVDVTFSENDEEVEGIEFEGRTIEVSLGVRRAFNFKWFHPYAGGGIAVIKSDIEATGFGETNSDDDAAVGYWAGGGLLWHIGAHVNLGLAVRFSGAETTLQGVDGESGGLHYGVAVGFSWPSRGH